MKTKLWTLLLSIVILTSCGSGGSGLPSVNGTQFEILVVIADSVWKSPGGRELKSALAQNMRDLPQAEPMLDVHQCNWVEFGDVLKPSRNIVLAEVSDKYTAPKIVYGKDKWAQPQAIVKITAPDDSAFANAIRTHRNEIVEYFIRSERERLIAFNKSNVNDVAKNQIEKMFGIQIDIPKGISKVTTGKDFIWITNDQPNVRQDIIVYSYPYRDKNTFTKTFIVAKRDSVLKVNIPGELKGSYMGTELKYAEPSFREIWVNEGYCAEVRGLWRMMNGAAMGGPFYSHTRLDEINQRVITIEGFVFAPGKNKRNAIRQLEAVVYSAKLPQEINAIREVSVVGKKEKK